MRIFRRGLWDEKASILTWSLVLGAYAYYAVVSFETIKKTQGSALQGIMENLPSYLQAMFGGIDIQTMDGWLNTQVFSWVSLVIAFYSSMYGAASLAGEVDRHTMESLLAQPIRRWSVVLQKFGIMAAGTAVVNLALLGAVLATTAAKYPNEPASTHGYWLVTVAGFLTALAAGAMAMFLSALENEQRRATVYATAAVILLYFLDVIRQTLEKANFLTSLNIFGRYHAAAIIKTGEIATKDVAFLAGFTAVFVALTVWWFARKDLA